MAASDGTHGYGTTLVSGTNGTIVNIISLGVDGQTRDSVDISTMDSTSKFREFVSAMADAGELSCEVNYDGADEGIADDLSTLYQAGATTTTWTITFPDTSTFVSFGPITNLGMAVPFDDKITQSLTIKLTGVPTFTDVAPS